jgi:hypothetical protein
MNPILAMNCPPLLAALGCGVQRYGAIHDNPAAVVVAGLYSQPIQPS